MSLSTKIYKGFQTAIPSEIRKKLKLEVDDIVEWYLDESGTVNIEFRKKSNFEDIIGIGKTPYKTDAVKMKKRVSKGEKP
ncbi:type II toxin-antitoxin system PrlF family antitoxin [Methanobrevibacter sp. TMH8]|uniref:type II toxin-antitoxin system PrlF family antitoxin n=1 Tax=Methanobrevibacter sp. TMH8 TaxID=2848611 RepID=UPI001CCBC3DC|nr:type II toxin-antitoxin system PrlF family antitoxin [Methanobrevibacter sp. TMH8]MBZ9570171.1 type II toxin-antitoxin system PrlF family antitoxin [Methanobrevibacter sp. TMH8]